MFLSSLLTGLSGGWLPSKINTLLWYDLADTSSVSTTSANITQINDKSGNALHATRTAGNGGTYSVGLNNLNVANLSGSQWLNIPSVSLSANYDITASVVYKQNNTNAHSPFCIGNANNPLMTFGLYGNLRGTNQYEVIFNSGNDFRSSASIDTNPNIVTITKTVGAINATTSLWKNGNASTDRGGSSTSIPNYQAATGRLGDFSSSVTNPINGYITELILTTDTSTLTRQTLEGYLAWKWGLVSGLPSDHPYKGKAP